MICSITQSIRHDFKHRQRFTVRQQSHSVSGERNKGLKLGLQDQSQERSRKRQTASRAACHLWTEVQDRSSLISADDLVRSIPRRCLPSTPNNIADASESDLHLSSQPPGLTLKSPAVDWQRTVKCKRVASGFQSLATCQQCSVHCCAGTVDE